MLRLAIPYPEINKMTSYNFANLQGVKTIRINLNLTFLSILLLLFSFTIKSTSYQVECIRIENNGDLTVNVWNPQKGKNYKLTQAQKDALHSVLFTNDGTQNNCGSMPPLLNNPESIQNFKMIEKTFFSNKGDWKRFTINSSQNQTIPQELGSQKWKIHTITISKSTLRKYLEEKQIIKPLNNGF